MIDRSDEVPQKTEVSDKTTATRRRSPGKVTSISKLPCVVINDRQDREIVADYIAAIKRQNELAPFIFAYGDTYARIRRNPYGRAVLEQVTVDVLMNIMKDAAKTMVLVEGKPHGAHVPKSIAVMILNEPQCLFQPIQGVKYIPFYRKDGTLCSEAGYDGVSGYYYDPIDDKSFAAIPSSQDAARKAASHFFDLVSDFPFASDADRANYLALAVTFVTQGSYSGKAAAAIIDAVSDAGTGKGFLTNIIHIIATGREFAAQSMPEDNQEMRKLLTSVAINGDPVIVFDNIRGKINSTALEAFLTAPYCTDRILGTNKTCNAPLNTITIMNGNNIQLGRDMPSRCYFIRLDAKESRAYTRKTFKIADIIPYVMEHRDEYLMDLLTIVKAWYTAGRPKASKTPYDGRFPSWASMVCSILTYAGVDHVFETALTDMINADTDQEEWETWLGNWHAAFGEEAVRVKDIADAVRSGQDAYADLSDSLPMSLAMEVDKLHDTRALASKVGIYLRMRKGRRYGESQFMLEIAGKDRSNVATWRVVIGKPHPISPLADEPPVTHVDITQSVFQEVEDAEQQPTRPSIPNNRPTQTPATPVIHPTACATCGSGTLYAISPRRDVWACNNPACSEWRNPRDIRNKIGYDE